MVAIMREGFAASITVQAEELLVIEVNTPVSSRSGKMRRVKLIGENAGMDVAQAAENRNWFTIKTADIGFSVFLLLEQLNEEPFPADFTTSVFIKTQSDMTNPVSLPDLQIAGHTSLKFAEITRTGNTVTVKRLVPAATRIGQLGTPEKRDNTRFHSEQIASDATFGTELTEETLRGLQALATHTINRRRDMGQTSLAGQWRLIFDATAAASLYMKELSIVAASAQMLLDVPVQVFPPQATNEQIWVGVSGDLRKTSVNTAYISNVPASPQTNVVSLVIAEPGVSVWHRDATVMCLSRAEANILGAYSSLSDAEKVRAQEIMDTIAHKLSHTADSQERRY
ncbi:MAG: hypothetical protein GX483_01040 [Actinomycetaceae bacterium]|nr:hypothetical protein [Actinomycetaceae bacterium]